MTQSYWPFNGIDTTETQYSQIFRRLQSTGVYGEDTDNSLKLVQKTGLTATIKSTPSGIAFVRGHMYQTDADVDITFTAGSANPRIDRVVLRLNPTTNTITPTIIEGVPAASNPEPPALVQTDAGNFDLLIAEVYRTASAPNVVTADITDRRSFMGHIYGLWTTNGRPAAPRKGQPGFNSTLLKPEFWNGTAWERFSAQTITASQVSDPQNLSVGTAANALKLNGRTVFVQPTAPSSPVVGDLWFSA